MACIPSAVFPHSEPSNRSTGSSILLEARRPLAGAIGIETALMVPLDAMAATAKDLGWTAWDQEQANRIEAEALKRSPLVLADAKETMRAFQNTLCESKIPFEQWTDLRRPSLDYPLTRILFSNAKQAIIGSPLRANAYWLCLLAGRAGIPLRLGGNTGTGKALGAYFYHKASRNKDNRPREPFVGLNCATLPRGIVEAELFGAVENAGSTFAERVGLFNLAHGGTIFLDEIGELPLDIQPKLLCVLQEGRLRKVGDSTETRVDVRIVAATNKDLRSEVAAGRFREDLFHRLDVMPVELPPLVSCPNEIIPLAHFMLDQHGVPDGTLLKYSFTPIASCALRTYSWPGNIRELENVVQRAVALGVNPIPAKHLQLQNDSCYSSFPKPVNNKLTPEQLEVARRMHSQAIGGDQIFRILTENHGFNKSRATLFRYLKDCGLVA